MIQRMILLLALPALLSGALAAAESCNVTTQKCLNSMAARLKNTGSIGIVGVWNSQAKGFRVTSFDDVTNAKEAGIRKGDILIAINGFPFSNRSSYEALLKTRKAGQQIVLMVTREGKKKSLPVILVAPSNDQIAGELGRHMLEHHVQTNPLQRR